MIQIIGQPLNKQLLTTLSITPFQSVPTMDKQSKAILSNENICFVFWTNDDLAEPLFVNYFLSNIIDTDYGTASNEQVLTTLSVAPFQSIPTTDKQSRAV